MYHPHRTDEVCHGGCRIHGSEAYLSCLPHKLRCAHGMELSRCLTSSIWIRERTAYGFPRIVTAPSRLSCSAWLKVVPTGTCLGLFLPLLSGGVGDTWRKIILKTVNLLRATLGGRLSLAARIPLWVTPYELLYIYQSKCLFHVRPRCSWPIRAYTARLAAQKLLKSNVFIKDTIRGTALTPD